MYSLNLKGRLWKVNRPLVMGIINITPDSFYSHSRFDNPDLVLKKAEQMLAEGADILDIGAQSTRPASDLISAKEELRRLIPSIELISEKIPRVVISVDSFYAEVASRSIEAGALIVNDVSGGTIDRDMLETVSGLHVPYICMHMPGTPQTMNTLNFYGDVTNDVTGFLAQRISACRKAGIVDVIADPGFGFGKNPDQNFELLSKLDRLQVLRVPVLVGLSRKSTIYKTLGITAEESLNGTTVLNTIALLKKAAILRVHDVKEAVEAVKLVSHLIN
ncbi:dihydropteroate synthase [Pollutibacter soli]|uniref:dihydropteroate synthase n=1 Tax=Pollutibacter soli TaxID=3034157 RepID=UPI003013A9F8